MPAPAAQQRVPCEPSAGLRGGSRRSVIVPAAGRRLRQGSGVAPTAAPSCGPEGVKRKKEHYQYCASHRRGTTRQDRHNSLVALWTASPPGSVTNPLDVPEREI